MDKIDKQTKAVLLALGEQLRGAREKRGVQQKQLAERIRMDPPNYAKIERGKKNVTIETLVRIADGLGVDLIVKFATRSRRHR